MKLIVGIGNPGKQYDKTRHNVGFMALDALAAHHNASFSEKKFNSVYTTIRIKNEKVIIMKPETFVNLSGNAVSSMMQYFNIAQEDILIVYDDLALPLGKIRVRTKGSGGGHNGIKNITSHLKNSEFKQFRIGIGNDDQIDRVNFVLGKFSKSDLKILDDVFVQFESVAEDFVSLSFSDFMSKHN